MVIISIPFDTFQLHLLECHVVGDLGKVMAMNNNNIA